MVVSQLRPSDVNDPAIVEAMATLPRELFVPEENRLVAYADRGVDIAPGRRLAPPLTTGAMLVEARPQPSDRVLVVAAGTGYLAALVAGMVDSVVALEADADLAEQATANLSSYTNVRLVTGALTEGFAEAAPYTLILVDGAVEELPESLTGQLAENGRIIAPVIDGGVTRLARGYAGDGPVALRPFANGASQPLTEFARHKAFQF